MPATVIHLVDPEQREQLAPATYDLAGADPMVKFPEGGMRIENGDGSATFDFGSGSVDDDQDSDEDDFYRNVADEIAEDELTRIASDLLTGIEMDQQSRKDWLETRAAGIRLLAFKIEEPRGDLGTSSAPLEGMSSFRHPALQEATVKFQATARGELLPATGPLKVRNDLPMRPDMPQNPFGMGGNGGPPMEGEAQQMDELASALEKDFNHYLTVTATEYVPDTDRMLFYIGFGGDGFKKVYNCPLRKRPVSESVDAEDIIVSNAATDMQNCARVTHRVKMRPSRLRRMQLGGHYRDVLLSAPIAQPQLNAVEKEKAAVGGYNPMPVQPRDTDHELYECYCELDLNKFAPKQFKGKELPLPYVVTVERDSRQVLAVRRNWNEDDDQALAKQFFVQFPFIRGLGFYGLGLIHLMGNVVVALTAMYREMIDSGMFASFPGFLYTQGAGRQKTNQLRVPPGGGFPVDVPPGMKIQDAFMPLPYKEPGGSFVNLVLHLEEVAQRIGQTADINIGEGKQDVPVGTTMALIEQATKIMDSVHKRLHAAQAEEFGLLKERFRENPDAFWRFNKRPARQWQKDQFLKALNEHDLVPVSDPNNPTSLHRIAKATIIDMLVQKYPLDIDGRAALKRILRIAGIESDGIINQQRQQPPPDPRMMAVQAKAQAEAMKNQIDQVKLGLDQQKAQAEFADNQAERAFKERMQQFEMQLEQLRVQAEMIIHAHDIQRDNHESQANIQNQKAETVLGIARDHAEHQHEMHRDREKHQQDMHMQREKNAMDVQMQREKNDMQMQVEHQKTQQQLEQQSQAHEVKLENDKKMGDAKAEAIGPAEKERAGREGEKHEQKMQIDKETHEMKGEKHKVDLANSKKLADAKAKALSRPKPAGDKK